MKKNQRGFSILGAFILLTALIGAVAFFVSGNNVSVSKSADKPFDIHVGSLLSQAASIEVQWTEKKLSGKPVYVIRTKSDCATFTYSGPNGEPCVGIQVDNPPSDVLDLPATSNWDNPANAGKWYIIDMQDNLSSGPASGNWNVAYTAPIKKSVCEKINKSFGIASIPKYDEEPVTVFLNLSLYRPSHIPSLCFEDAKGSYGFYKTLGNY